MLDFRPPAEIGFDAVITGLRLGREIVDERVGDIGEVKLISGEVRKGRVRFISKKADAATRTFLVEIEIDNQDRTFLKITYQLK